MQGVMTRNESSSKDGDTIQADKRQPDDLRARFERLLQENQGIIFKVAHTYCSHVDDREDLFQEICWQLWRALPNYDPSRKFSTWMYRVALNVGISHLRQTVRRKQHDLSIDSDEMPELVAPAPAETDERIALLNQIISQFEPLDRALLLLYLEEHSYRETAEVLGISESNVATKISRLKQRIRQQMVDG